MCVGAETMAIFSIASSVLSAGMQFVGQQSAASSARAQAEYQAQVAKNNQILANNAAIEAEEAGRVREAQNRAATQRLIGRQRAVFASNGVLVDEGSALATVEDTVAQGELDALTIRSDAEREAMGYRNQGENFGGEAALATARAKNASSGGLFGAGGTLLSGLGTVAQKWYP